VRAIETYVLVKYHHDEVEALLYAHRGTDVDCLQQAAHDADHHRRELGRLERVGFVHVNLIEAGHARVDERVRRQLLRNFRRYARAHLVGDLLVGFTGGR